MTEKSKSSPFIENSLFILILACLIVVPLYFTPYTWANYMTPKTTAFRLIVWFMLLIYIIADKKRFLVQTPVLLPFLFLMVGEVISALVAVNLGEALSFEYMPNLFTLFFFYLISTAVIRTPDRIKTTSLVIVIIGLIVSVYGFMQLFHLDPFKIFPPGQRIDPVSTFGCTHELSFYSTIGIPLALFLVITCRNIFIGSFSFIAALIMILAMFKTGDNSAVFGFGLGLIGVFLIFIYYKVLPSFTKTFSEGPNNLDKTFRKELSRLRKIFIILIIVILILISLFASFKIKNGKLWNYSRTNIFQFEVWKSGLYLIKIHPIMGIGDGNFKIVHPLYTSALENKVLGNEVLARKTHSDYIWVWLSKGLIGIIAYLWLIFVMIKCFRFIFNYCSRNKSMKSHYIFWFSLVSVWGSIAILFQSIFRSIFVQPTSVILVFILLAMINVVYTACKNESQFSNYPLEKPKSAPLTLLLLAIWILVTPLLFLQYSGEIHLRKGMIAKLNYDMYTPYIKQGKTEYTETQTKYFDEVFTEFKKAQEIYPHEMEQYYILGRYCIDLNLPREGIELLKTDLYYNPNYKWAHNNIGVCYDRLSDVDNARYFYKMALEIDPEQIFAHFNLGIGYMKEKRYEDAIKEFEKNTKK